MQFRSAALLGVLVPGLACARTKVEATCPTPTPLPAIAIDSVSSARGVLTGRVVGHVLGRPVDLARIALEPGHRQALADTLGRFRVDSVAAGTYALDVRRAGYEARRDSLAISDRGLAVVVYLEELKFDVPCVNPVVRRTSRL